MIGRPQASGDGPQRYQPVNAGLGIRTLRQMDGATQRLIGGLSARSVNVTGLAQKLGQLEAVNRDFQSKYWATLPLLGPTL